MLCVKIEIQVTNFGHLVFRKMEIYMPLLGLNLYLVLELGGRFLARFVDGDCLWTYWYGMSQGKGLW